MWNTGANMTTRRESAYPMPQTECANSAACDQKALQIQAREAVTADGAFDVALGQLILSFVGVVGVGFTVFYARLAWREALRSADVADGALKLSADTADRQLRPYLYLTTDRDDPQPVTNDGHVRVSVKNFGQTPARKIRLHRGTDWLARPIGDQTPPLRFVEDLLDLGPGADLRMLFYMEEIPADAFAFLGEGTHVLIIRMRVDYEYAPGLTDFHEVIFTVGKEAVERGQLILVNAAEREKTHVQ